MGGLQDVRAQGLRTLDALASLSRENPHNRDVREEDRRKLLEEILSRKIDFHPNPAKSDGNQANSERHPERYQLPQSVSFKCLM